MLLMVETEQPSSALHMCRGRDMHATPVQCIKSNVIAHILRGLANTKGQTQLFEVTVILCVGVHFATGRHFSSQGHKRVSMGDFALISANQTQSKVLFTYCSLHLADILYT